MNYLPTPSVPDLARAEGQTLDEVVNWFRTFYNSDLVPWNYNRSARILRAAYRGMHQIGPLLQACEAEANLNSRRSHADVVTLSAPVAFGRNTRVFDLTRRKFRFGQSKESGFRIPFFFTEDKIVKLYYLQPRKAFSLSHDQISMVATIHKRYVLDQEFFGINTDLEYADVSENPKTGIRELKIYSMANLNIWPAKKLEERLTLIASALDIVQASGLVRQRRPRPTQNSDMPLFD